MNKPGAAAISQDGPLVVVKLGSNSATKITEIDGKKVRVIDSERIGTFVSGVMDLRSQGYRVVVVSSGAVAGGMAIDGLIDRPSDPSVLGELASIGQPRLMDEYNRHLSSYNIALAQILPERESYHNKERREHIFNVRRHNIENGRFVVINENDAVVSAELRFGDNDFVALLEAMGMHADYLLLLTDSPGIMTGDPKTDPNAQLIESVDDVTSELFAINGNGGGIGSAMGSVTKIYASDIARHSGIQSIVASSEHAGDLIGLIEGRVPATRFTVKDDRRYDLDIACAIIDEIAKSADHIDVSGFYAGINEIANQLGL